MFNKRECWSKYYIKNKGRILEKNKKWSKRNSEKTKQYQKKYYNDKIKNNPEIKEKQKQLTKKWRKENAEHLRNYYKERRKSPIYKEILRKSQAKNRKKIRKVVLEYYGNKCKCCSETTFEFLAIDHIKGGGGKHRKEINKKYRSINEYLYFNNFPEGFQILCHNCNLAKGFYGRYPHKKVDTNVI